MPLPKHINPVIEEINARPYDASKKDVLPEYISHQQVQEKLGERALSLMGGADVSSLASPKLKTLIIVDRLPFLNTAPLDDLIDNDRALFHAGLIDETMKHAFRPYASMRNHYDHDSPYGILNLAHYHGVVSETWRDNDPLTRTLYQEKFSSELQSHLGISSILLYRLRVCLNATILAIDELSPDLYCIHIKKQAL